MSCAQAATLMLLHDRTGKCVDEATLRRESEVRGHPPGYDKNNGTSVLDIPTMMAEHGSPGAKPTLINGLSQSADQTAEQIQAETDKHSTIVLLQNPGHFVVVDGFRTAPDGTRYMQIRDPALPGNQGCREIEVGGSDWNNRLNGKTYMLTQ